jgi:MFS family permease
MSEPRRANHGHRHAGTGAPPPSATGTLPAEIKARNAIRAGVLAFFVDQFDIYLPVLVLAPVLAYFQPSDIGAGTAAILSAAIFASTLIFRPVGAAIFGHLADTTGRKRATLIAVAGFGIVTLLIACLPGHESIGVWSIILLIALRSLNGVFLGGEYSAAVPLAMEWSPKQRRGYVGGLILAGSPAAYGTIAALTFLLLQVLPSAGNSSAYAQWGWRIPFVIGAALAGLLFVHYLRSVEEPATRRTKAGQRAPIVELFVGRNRRSLLQVFILMSGVWLANNMVSAVLPGLQATVIGLTGSQVSITAIANSAVAVLSFICFGVLSQRIGRRRFYLWYGCVMALIGSTIYAVLMTVEMTFFLRVLLTALVGVATIGTFGPVASYITERFPAEIRSTGFGIGYSLALVLPAFYAFYLEGLRNFVSAGLAPVVLIVLAGILVSVGGFLGPETRDVDMGSADPLDGR